MFCVTNSDYRDNYILHGKIYFSGNVDFTEKVIFSGNSIDLALVFVRFRGFCGCRRFRHAGMLNFAGTSKTYAISMKITCFSTFYEISQTFMKM